MKTRKWLTLLTLVFCMVTCCITARAYDTSNLTIPSSAKAIVYGKSGAGRSLMAYQFGDGENVMVLGFALHGWEDNFSQDGGALVYTAGQLMQLLDKNMDIVDDYDWTIYVLPCMNPDGLIDGYSHNGPGRLTTTYLDSSGTLSSSHGVDLNRSFPTLWTKYTSARNYNGSQPLAANEAKALSQFVQDVKGDGVNLCLDVHGWTQQIITSNGSSSTLFQIFKAAFPQNTYSNCRSGQGYFTAYTTTLGYASCLFEFPDGIYSMSQFQKSGYCEKFNSCVLSLAKAYGSYGARNVTVSVQAKGDGTGTVTGGGTYQKGQTVTLTAVADEGSKFVGWSDGGTQWLSRDATYSFTAQNSVTVYASFATPVTVTAWAQEGGTVSGSGTYASGEKVTVTAAPEEGYLFTGWYDRNGTFLSKDLSYSWAVSANTTVYAHFERAVIVTAKAQGDGTVTGGGSYLSGTTVTLTASPSAGGTFLGWYDRNGTLLGTDTSYSWAVSANTTVYGRFDAQIQLKASRSGSASGDGYYESGTTATLTAAPAETFAGWYDLSGNLVSTEPSFQYSVEQGTTLVAMFQGDRFYDISGWYLEDVMAAAERGLVEGVTDISFDPSGKMTRAQVVMILARLDGADTADAAVCPFTDVNQSQWYAGAVNWAYETGIVDGISPTQFGPNGKVTRQDFVTMVIRYLESVRGLTLEEAALSFTDAASVSDYARSPMQKAAALGLVEGYEDGSILPKNQISRSEGVTILMRLARYLDTLPEVTPEEPEEAAPEEAPETSPEDTPETSETPETGTDAQDPVTPTTSEETPEKTQDTESGTEPTTETTTKDTETPAAQESKA
jgi:hypothetical protein